MLSVTAIHSKEYYVNLAREDYYLQGGEPPGKCYGQGAAALDLQGQIEPEQFRFIVDGFSADGQRKLVQNAGDEKRQPGWDLTFSAPKTVSVIWSQSDQETRWEIQQAQEAATRRALDWLEAESITRRGRGGHLKEPARLIVATFEHGTSRAQDPQLHTHCLIMNAAVRGDGSTGAIESQQFYQNKMTAGALYRAELAKQLEARLGLQAIKQKEKSNLFEIRGVDPALVEEFSKRRQAIEQALETGGHTSAKAAEIAALDTREVKGHQARETLFAEWQKIGAAYGYQPPESRIRYREKSTTTAALQAWSVEMLTDRNSSFTERDLLRKMAEAAPGSGLGARDIQHAVRAYLQHSPIVCLGRVREEIRYTTEDMLQLETSMLKQVADSAENISHPVRERLLTSIWEEFPTLKAEQQAAVNHLVNAHGTIKVVEGWAGTGKTYMLNVAREAWARSGYQVYGAALSAKAASGLTDGANIHSQTLHSLLHRIQEGQLHLNARSVVVIDEASMVGTKQLASLISLTTKADAKLVLVGDSKQLQAIEAGGGFTKISEMLGAARLTEITRQTIVWMRQAVRDMIQGNAKDVLEMYAQHGQLNVQETWNEARTALITAWKENGMTAPENNIILAGTNLDVFNLNQQAQEARQQAGLLSENSVTVGGASIRENDRVLFTRNNRTADVKNGQLGTVKRIDGKILSVQLDSGEVRTINTNSYDHIKLGYAMSTHKAQGDTRQRSYVLVGGTMQDRELSYVQLSRSKAETSLFSDRMESGDALTRLARSMERSRKKELASTHLPQWQQSSQYNTQLLP
ncbi:MAG: MobF family relaxase [Cyanobacteria bacterium P01_A01_bin.17]